MKICKLCLLECEKLEVHHIIPISRGGKEDCSNLIEICLECHGKVHDVSFKGSRGLIKEGVEKCKTHELIAKNWSLSKNADSIINNWLNDMYDKDENKYRLIVECMNFGIITKIQLFNHLALGKKLRTRSTIIN